MLELGFCEKIVYGLRSLYNRYGYSQYKMSKFEEYDLYARNKDFLISDSVITFMDPSGKLMALKPDVTLSIVKNTKDTASLQKLYYDENVYRADKNSHSFREITQVGLECQGAIDDYCIAEVLLLAAGSLELISDQSVLQISHLGLVATLLEDIGIKQQSRALQLIGQKNIHELMALCTQEGVTEENAQVLKTLVQLCGKPETVLPQAEKLLCGITDTAPLKQLAAITAACDTAILRLDFSVVDDVHYYNGIVFKGFVQGLPSSVLSGGQYDKLMRKLKRTSGAIGFAVYMDALERLDTEKKEFDVDTVLLYAEGADLKAIAQKVKQLNEAGCSVSVQRNLPENLRYRQVVEL